VRSVRNRVLYLIVVSLGFASAPVWPCTVHHTHATYRNADGGYRDTTTYRVHYWYSDYGWKKSKPPGLEEMMRADRRDPTGAGR
jgi:hypothetical protein